MREREKKSEESSMHASYDLSMRELIAPRARVHLPSSYDLSRRELIAHTTHMHTYTSNTRVYCMLHMTNL